MAANEILIRQATADDAKTLLCLIRELAEYEKLTQLVVADEELLKMNLFGEKSPASALLAYYNGQPAGMAIYFRNFSTFLARPGLYLEDIYVRPELRGKGIGKKLFGRLAQIALDNGYGRFEWSVLDWNTPAIKFYESMNAVEMKEWKIFRLTGESIEAVAKSNS